MVEDFLKKYHPFARRVAKHWVYDDIESTIASVVQKEWETYYQERINILKAHLHISEANISQLNWAFEWDRRSVSEIYKDHYKKEKEE